MTGGPTGGLTHMTSILSLTSKFAACIAAIALFFSASTPAAACISGGRQGPMPLCSPQILDPSERTIALSGNVSLPTNIQFRVPDRVPISANLIDIEIESTDKPLHIVFSHAEAAIFRFTGKTDAIARVTALPAVVGTIGIDPTRITHVAVTGHDMLRITACGAPPKACTLESLFHVPKLERGLWHSSWPPFGERPRIEEAAWIGGTTRVVIDRNGVSRLQRLAVEDSHAWKRQRATPTPLAAYLEDPGPATILDPVTINATVPLEVAPTLPSWEGLAEFERRGLLHFSGSPTFDRVYDSWAERFSARYRPRLGAQFAIRPPIDAVVTGHIRIPHDLRPYGSKPSVALLIARDAPIPEMDRWSGACFFFDDERTHHQSCNRLSAPDLATQNLLAEDERLERLRRRRN